MAFEEHSFDMALLFYTPQCLVGYHELVDILKKARQWARLVGVVDHRAVPCDYAKSVFTLSSWIEYDVGREIGAETLRLGFPFHEGEIKRALKEAGWRSAKDGSFPALVGSPDNAIPLSVMKDNVDRLESHVKGIKDCRSRELYISKIFVIRKLIEARLPKFFFYAVLAGRDSYKNS